jgi:hypothetical protein
MGHISKADCQTSLDAACLCPGLFHRLILDASRKKCGDEGILMAMRNAHGTAIVWQRYSPAKGNLPITVLSLLR